MTVLPFLRRLAAGALVALAGATLTARATVTAQPTVPTPDWAAVEGEALTLYQSLIRFDTVTSERAAAEYIAAVLTREGIPATILATDPARPNVVARLKGSGRRRPLLLMGHIDTVPVDESKWRFPPFSATRDGGFVYGRGAIDDKDNLAAAMMTMILLHRLKVPLDRDVILLAESGEESASNLGIGFMIREHYDQIDAEYCIAEGGDTIREGGAVTYASVQVNEKVVRGIELVATGVSGHGSVPLRSNAVARLGAAVGRFAAWQPAVRIDETTGTFFRRLALLAPPDRARHYRDVLSPDPAVAGAAADWLFEHEPRYSSMARTSVSPTLFTGGYRSNVIPSEARARLDVRLVPGEDAEALLAQVRAAIDDPAIEVRYAGGGAGRPAIPSTRVDSELFTAAEAAVQDVYGVPALPAISTYATDMWQLRARGVQCIGIGAAVDVEDQVRGFGMHSDQERLLEHEFQRFVRLNWSLVTRLAAAR